MNRILLCMLSLFGICICMAQGHQDDNAYKKECKKVCSQLKKDGWKMYGSSQLLETAMNDYNRRQDTEKLVPIIGCGSAESINFALRKATNHAIVQYATLKGSHLQGLSTTVMHNNGVGASGTESYGSVSVTSVSQSVKALKQSFTLTRQLHNNTIEARIYYLVKP